MQLLEVAVGHARKELVRFESLVSSKTIQQQSFDEQKFVLQSREGELGKAKAELRSAQAPGAHSQHSLGLRSAEAHLKSPPKRKLGPLVIRAPIDGEITARF